MSDKSAKLETVKCGTAQDDSSDDETEGADLVEDEEFDEDQNHNAPEHDEDAESLDPRIQEELEKLNSSTDVINKLEVDLEEARHTFRILMKESGQQLERLAKQIGPTSVEKARPYYEARMRARKAHAEAQRAAVRFEKASNAHEAAKEMVNLAEEGYKERGCLGFDQAWQEMLNHASTRVNDSEAERNASAEDHCAKSKAYSKAESEVQNLQKSLKKYINKSRSYFEVKARFNQILDDQKRQVQLIEETIVMTKNGYSDSLKELEKISEEIHERRARRRQQCQNNIDKFGVRQSGVGAEDPMLPNSSGCPIDVSQACDHDGDETDGLRLNAAAAAVVSSQCNNDDEASLLPGSSNAAEKSANKQKRVSLDPDEIKDVNSSCSKMQHLSVRRLSDDEFSEADSMISMEQLDDDQIEQLMLESDGFDTLEDASADNKHVWKLI